MKGGNICAHDEKIYDIRLVRSISSNYIHNSLNLNQNKNLGFQDLFSIVIILKILLFPEEFNKFFSIFVRNLEELKQKLHSIEFQCVLNKMGFPENYKELLAI